MRIILHSSSLYIGGAVLLIGIALYFLVSAIQSDNTPLVTAVVDRGNVAEIVSVSGVVEAENAADLAFPVIGIVTDVPVEEGDHVSRGAVLATLASKQLVAERQDAVALLTVALASRDELIAGPTSEARNVITQTVQNAKENLSRVISEEGEKVKNARRALLSTNLIARTDDPYEDAVPPTVTGTYLCETTGTYIIDVYSSGSASGYSYRIKGLEYGTYAAFTDNPGSFGICGLSLQFDSDSVYGGSTWSIEVPNTRSSSYTTNLNAYELAETQAQQAIDAAEDALKLAEDQATLENADPRTESLRRADANVAQARARIAVIDAQITDRSIVAPFDGIITDVSILPGETATAEPVITLLSSDAFELTARIPEIDITKLTEGQRANIVFDARKDEVLAGTIDFISPLALEIDGVAYFKATIAITDTPLWLRSGLNADIDIIVGEATDVLRVPKRFVDMTLDTPRVLIHDGDTVVEQAVELGFIGNDGYVEITGLTEGTEIVAP